MDKESRRIPRRKVESLNCKKWKSVCYRVVDKWRDILVDYFEKNHNFRPEVDAFANKKKQKISEVLRRCLE